MVMINELTQCCVGFNDEVQVQRKPDLERQKAFFAYDDGYKCSKSIIGTPCCTKTSNVRKRKPGGCESTSIALQVQRGIVFSC